MIRRLTLSFAVVTLIGALVTGWLYASETQSTTITFVAPGHFLMLDGNDVQVPAGTYRIEQAGESQLRLLSESAPPIQIAATKIVHEERVSSLAAIAVMEEGQDDTLHLLLVLADGQGLDATGSLSGPILRDALSVTTCAGPECREPIQSHRAIGACSTLTSADSPGCCYRPRTAGVHR